MAHLSLVIVCALLSVAAVAARAVSIGDYQVPCQPPCAAASIDPTSAAAMPPGCPASAIMDLSTRWSLPEYPASWTPTTASRKYWGPDLNVYAAVNASQVSAKCNPTAWAWYRLMRVVNDTIALDINYCHHHAPAYITPVDGRVVCNPSEPGVDSSSCVCNAAGLNRTLPWQGVDCSNLAAFVYNLAFGYYPTSAIGELACHPTYAPGRLLNVSVSNLQLLYPGDLVFITLSKTGRTPPVRVSHVVLWTGLTANLTVGATGPLSKAALMANLPTSQVSSVESCISKRVAAGLPVYVIADSSNNGPAFRPFCGWYISSYSHARRVIDPPTTLPTNANNVAVFNATSGDCMSYWALQA